METILILGSGAREHAIAAALARSPQRPTLLGFGSAVNPGIANLCESYTSGSLTQADPIITFATTHKATLAIIGPEAPLAAGLADALIAAGIPTVGPTKSLARIESSKAFTRNLLAKYQIPGNPFYQRFQSLHGVEEVLNRFPHQHVIKDDGLAGGKGVKVCGDHLHSLEDSLDFCRELSSAGHPFVVEEKLEGEEFSLLSFCDGQTLAHMPAVQDHKRAFNADKGPNTGGMGSYTAADHSLPFLTPQDIAEARHINEQVAQALAQECNAPYRGILYGGFMATASGVRLIEYNARFGDPESLNLLSLLESDFLAICQAIAGPSTPSGTAQPGAPHLASEMWASTELSEPGAPHLASEMWVSTEPSGPTRTLAQTEVLFARQASVCKYLVPDGYPDTPRIGDPVTLPTNLPPGVTLYLSAVDMQHNQLVATGSRTVAVVAVSDHIATAEALCEQIITQISGPFFHRTDIGTAPLIARRIDHMRALRP